MADLIIELRTELVALQRELDRTDGILERAYIRRLIAQLRRELAELEPRS